MSNNDLSKTNFSNENKADDGFTPVNGKRTKRQFDVLATPEPTKKSNVPNAPFKLKRESPLFEGGTKLDFSNVTSEKQSKRNLDILNETTDKKPKNNERKSNEEMPKSQVKTREIREDFGNPFEKQNKRNTDTNEEMPKSQVKTREIREDFGSPFEKQNKRNMEMSGLEEEIFKKSGGVKTREIREEFGNPFDKQNKKTREIPKYTHEVKEKEKEKKINVNDTESFPTLGNDNLFVPAVVKTENNKASVWNVFNPNLVGVKTVEKKAQPKLIVKQQVVNKPIIVTNNYSDDEYSEDYSEEQSEEANNYENEMEEDSDVVYKRELYQKRYDTIDQILYVKKNIDFYDINHLKFLKQLQSELYQLDDEIYRTEQLDNELERIYGPSYFNESLYDDAVKKRKEAEENKRNEEKSKEFLRMMGY